MPSLAEIVDAIHDALLPLTTEIDGLQVVPFMNLNPTPPSIDIYPADPFQAPSSFSLDDRALFFTVRARANVADREAGQRVLLDLLDPASAASVERALTANGLGADEFQVGLPEGTPTGFRIYDDSPGELVGVEWRFEVLT